ncbi:uncharacterized protein LOC113312245 [Papaver somniferum]|uniref:uncharacterized protein LOC113312245 n=1 Tax=Papaver somniferum TaxID=3469 RepID=UPI000E7060FD|nr:uncharacterized protein LOC113312245 [Papaver somniferum]
MIWSSDLKGKFSTSAIVERIRSREPKVNWPAYKWKPFLHPATASNIWKIQHQIYVDDKVMMKNGFERVSRCCICTAEHDCMDHTLWECKFSLNAWAWICSIFDFEIPQSFNDVCKSAQHKSPLIREIWMTVACKIMKELWFQKNNKLFEEKSPQFNEFKRKIWQSVHEGGFRMKGTKWGQIYDQNIIDLFQLGVKHIKYNCIRECYWESSNQNFVLFCCDGSSLGNPGAAGLGVIARDSSCEVIGTMSGGVGNATNYIEEILAVISALEWAFVLKAQNVIIRSDSKTVVNDFCNNCIPWMFRARWLNAKQNLECIIFQHCFREVNFSADDLAKRGAGLRDGERIIHTGRPSFLKRSKMPNVVYYRLIFGALLAIFVPVNFLLSSK